MSTDQWFDFSDSVVVISGAGGAIGRELSLAFARHGARVIVVDVDGEAAERVAAEVSAGQVPADPSSSGPGAVAARVDVTRGDEVEALLTRVTTEEGPVDVVVNAAAIYVRTPAVELTRDDWDRTIDINVTGTWLMTQAAGRSMIERGRGRIINYASNAGNRGSASQVAYNASKAAVISLTKSLAVEWAQTGVTVNAVAPGPTDTALMAPAFADPALVDAFAKRVPQGILTEPDVTVGPVLFLASSQASSITGHVLYADGGMSAT